MMEMNPNKKMPETDLNSEYEDINSDIDLEEDI
jgi:hypothetical protein